METELSRLIAAATVTRFVLPHLLPANFRIHDVSAIGLALTSLVRRAAALRWAVGILLLAACVVLYDGVLKPTPLGPLAMGGCRMLNVLLGMSLAMRELELHEWLIAGGIGLYIAGLTWFARSEAEEVYAEQITEAVSSDPDTAAYVEELERRADTIDELVGDDDLPTGESLAAELTQFLRDRESNDPPAAQ